MREGNIAIVLRVYDYATACVAGVLAAWLASFIISPQWSMPVGMIAGMAVGFVSLAAMFIGLGWIAGGFEIIMPGMFITMGVGMSSGMWITAGDPSTTTLMVFGVFISLYVGAIFHGYDKSLHGELHLESAKEKQ